MVVCRPGLIGRYVYIALSGSNQILTLCEVEVYGLPGKADCQRAGLLIVIILVEIIPCPTPNESFVLNLYSI